VSVSGDAVVIEEDGDEEEEEEEEEGIRADPRLAAVRWRRRQRGAQASVVPLGQYQRQQMQAAEPGVHLGLSVSEQLPPGESPHSVKGPSPRAGGGSPGSELFMTRGRTV
jgi:hypothetical protein